MLLLVQWLALLSLLTAAAAAVQAQYRKSLPVGDHSNHSPSASPSPAVRRRIMSDSEHRDEDENADTHVADQRRRRFTAVASLALRKTMDGPQHGADGEEVTAKNLRSLLAKTSAANVSCLISRTSLHFPFCYVYIYICVS